MRTGTSAHNALMRRTFRSTSGRSLTVSRMFRAYVYASMNRTTLALLAFSLGGCDTLNGDNGPMWTRDGSSAHFDYTPGLDSLHDYTPAYVAIPATQRAVRMFAGPAPSWSRADVVVRWDAPGFSDPVSPFYNELIFPLEEDNLVVSPRGLEVVVPARCSGGIPSGSASWVRVPRTPTDVQELAACSLSPGRLYRAVGTVMIPTPEGSFEAFILEGPAPMGGTFREFWNWEIGLLRLDVLNEDGVLRGRFTRSS